VTTTYVDNIADGDLGATNSPFLNTTGFRFYRNSVLFAHVLPEALIIGDLAGVYNAAAYNTFIGNSAGKMNTTGYANCFLGYHAGVVNTTGLTNTFLGYRSGCANLTGDHNTFIGVDAGQGQTVGDSSVIIGYHAGLCVQPSAGLAGNVYIGSECAAYLVASDGTENTGIGYHNAYNITSGIRNSFLGSACGFSNTTGGYNAFYGYRAGFSNTEAAYNTFLGAYSGYYITTGDKNIHIGSGAGYGGTTTNAPATDTYGILIGYYANRSVVTATALTNYIGIGYGVEIDKDNQVKIGNTSITETCLYGNIIGNGEIKCGDAYAYSGKQALSIDDDAVYSFTPGSTIGILCLTATATGFGAIIAYRAGTSPYCVGLALGASVEVTTGILAGTTGTDGKTTVSTHTDGKIYIENRRGGATIFEFVMIAGS